MDAYENLYLAMAELEAYAKQPGNSTLDPEWVELWQEMYRAFKEAQAYHAARQIVEIVAGNQVEGSHGYLERI